VSALYSVLDTILDVVTVERYFNSSVTLKVSYIFVPVYLFQINTAAFQNITSCSN